MSFVPQGTLEDYKNAMRRHNIEYLERALSNWWGNGLNEGPQNEYNVTVSTEANIANASRAKYRWVTITPVQAIEVITQLLEEKKCQADNT